MAEKTVERFIPFSSTMRSQNLVPDQRCSNAIRQYNAEINSIRTGRKHGLKKRESVELDYYIWYNLTIEVYTPVRNEGQP